MKMFFTVFIFFFLIYSLSSFAQEEKQSIIDSPHELNVERWLQKFPHSFTPLNPPGSNPEFITDFLNVNISNDPFPQNEPSVKISRSDPNRVVAAWRDFRTGVNPPLRRVGFSLSTDGGETWSVSELLPQIIPSALLSSDPVVDVDINGNFYIYTVSLNDFTGSGELWVFKSTDGGETFNEVYQMTNTTAFEDKEWTATDLNPASPFANNLYCSWTRFSGGTEILLVRSTDEGINWSTPVSVSDESSVQGSFPAVGPNGELYVVWRHSGQIMFDKSTDGGITFGTDLVVSNAPSAWFPHMAVDLSGGPRNGYIYVTWNDERNGDDDAFVCYSSDSGDSWSTPIRVNNDPVGNGKIQYWPSIAISELGEITILFYDTRNTSSNSFIEAYIARSIVRFGDYIAIDAYGGNVVPVWTDERAGGFDMDIYTAVINPIVPVELTTFSAKVRNGKTILKWQTATELNNLGFEIERSLNQETWRTIGFVEGHGTTTESQSYSFADIGIGGTVYYRLKQIDFDGTYEFSFVIEVNSATVTTMDLEQNYPNPFNPNTNIKYQVGNDRFVKLEVFNSLGEVVATLVSEFKQAGTYQMSFNGEILPSGVYIYILKSGNFIQSKKMILLK